MKTIKNPISVDDGGIVPQNIQEVFLHFMDNPDTLLELSVPKDCPKEYLVFSKKFGVCLVDEYDVEGRETEKLEDLIYELSDCDTLFSSSLEKMCKRVVGIVYENNPISVPWEHIDPRFNWVVKGEDGNVYLLECKPNLQQDNWVVDNGDSVKLTGLLSSVSVPEGAKWFTTLTKRPISEEVK